MTGRVSLPRGWKEWSNGKAQQRGYWQSVSKAASRREKSRDIKTKCSREKEKKYPLFPGYVIMWGTDMWSGCRWLTTENRPEGGSRMGQNLAHMISALQNTGGWFASSPNLLKPRKQPMVPFSCQLQSTDLLLKKSSGTRLMCLIVSSCWWDVGSAA